MTTENFEAKLAALKPRLRELGQRFDDAATDDEREAIRKEAEELMARAAIQQLIGQVTHQLLASFGMGNGFHSGGRITAPLRLPFTGCASHEFMVPKP